MINKEQQSVRNWMANFNQDTPSKPIIPSLEVRKLRAKLILEEALETIHALGLCPSIECSGLNQVQVHSVDPSLTFEDYGDLNLEQILDGCLDLRVVERGTLAACGMSDIEEKAFKEVMRSNNSKVWTSEEARKLSLDYSMFETKLGYWIVKDKDGKIVKPPSYFPPNLAQFLPAKESSST